MTASTKPRHAGRMVETGHLLGMDYERWYAKGFPRAPRHLRRSSVYRVYDRLGRLLYIGLSDCVAQRIYYHLAGVGAVSASGPIAWWGARVVEVSYPHRGHAEDAERLSIAAERPYFNGLWNFPGPDDEYVPPGVDPVAFAAAHRARCEAAMDALADLPLVGGRMSGNTTYGQDAS